MPKDLFDEELDDQFDQSAEEHGGEEEHDDHEEESAASKDLNAAEDHSEEGHEETEEEREAIRARRRQERQERKQRAKEREESNRRAIAARDSEIAQLRQRLDQVEHRNSAADLAQIDGHMQRLNNAYIEAQKFTAAAATENKGEDYVRGTERMMEIREEFNRLKSIRANAAQVQRQPSPTDMRVAALAQAWHAKNQWYDPSLGDEDSEHAQTIDRRMVREGWNPATEEYWEEFDRRVAQRLPHRAGRAILRGRGANGSGNTEPKGAPGGGSSKDGGRKGGNSEGGYTLSSERVQALKDAGLWNDPDKRKKAIAQYKEYDKQHAGE